MFSVTTLHVKSPFTERHNFYSNVLLQKLTSTASFTDIPDMTYENKTITVPRLLHTTETEVVEDELYHQN